MYKMCELFHEIREKASKICAYLSYLSKLYSLKPTISLYRNGYKQKVSTLT